MSCQNVKVSCFCGSMKTIIDYNYMINFTFYRYPIYKTPLIGTVPLEYGMTMNEFRNFDNKPSLELSRANKYGELRPRWVSYLLFETSNTL